MDFSTCSDEVFAEAANRLLARGGPAARDLRDAAGGDLVEFVANRDGLFMRRGELAKRCALLELQLALVAVALPEESQAALIATGLLTPSQVEAAKTYLRNRRDDDAREL